jgi:hypothetical protein
VQILVELGVNMMEVTAQRRRLGVVTGNGYRPVVGMFWAGMGQYLVYLHDISRIYVTNPPLPFHLARTSMDSIISTSSTTFKTGTKRDSVERKT